MSIFLSSFMKNKLVPASFQRKSKFYSITARQTSAGAYCTLFSGCIVCVSRSHEMSTIYRSRRLTFFDRQRALIFFFIICCERRRTRVLTYVCNVYTQTRINYWRAMREARQKIFAHGPLEIINRTGGGAADQQQSSRVFAREESVND